MYNAETVPMFKMHNEGSVLKLKMHNIGTTPTFKMHNIGTVPKLKLCRDRIFDDFVVQLGPSFKSKSKV